MVKEPAPLLRGKSFHEKIQRDWEESAQGKIAREKAVTKPNGRKGRIDVRALSTTDDGEMSAVLEAKATNWEAMTPQAVRRNIRRHVRQVWSYIEAELAKGRAVCPGIVFPHLPEDPELVRLVEDTFFGEGISVVWDDETIEECKVRNSRKDDSG